MSQFSSFLSEDGQLIFDAIKKHCKEKLKMMDVDDFELAMLANSLWLYADNARVCNETGISMTFTTEKGGEYSQVRPEYTVMTKEYQNVLKHSAKFGLNPGDREKIFKHLNDGKGKKKGFNLGMKAA